MPRKKQKFIKKFFPFSPGIPWIIRSFNFVIPYINLNIWNTVFQDKTFTVACYSGLLESFFSLSYMEAFAKIDPSRKLFYMAEPEFGILAKMQGIAKISPYNLGPDIVLDFPVPVFMDSQNGAYFNTVLDYIITKSYKKDIYTSINRDIILKQIYKNCMLPWNNYIPKLRNVDEAYIDKWRKENKLPKNKKYILIFPNKYNTVHDIDCLQWSPRQIVELSEMLRHLNISVISCEHKVPERYEVMFNTGQVIKAPMDLNIMIPLMQGAYGILSRDIDFLFIAMMVSDACIMSRELGSIYDIYENANFISARNDIFTDMGLSPSSVFKYIEGISGARN